MDIEKLLSKAQEIEQEDARTAKALGFTARALAIATMPHKKPKEHVFKRRNGNFCLTMIADPEVGLPYGSAPRLLVAWLTTEVQRTKERRIVLGPSLGGFMRDVGITPSTGRWGTKTRFRSQMERLFSCYIRSTWDGTYEDKVVSRGRNRLIADDYELWWDPASEDQATLWQSWVDLGEKFFKELVEHPVPVDLRALKALRQSPLALDIYTWLTYRNFSLNEPLALTWSSLQGQLGADYPLDAQGERNFRRKFVEQLKNVLAVYPEAKVDVAPEALILYPSPTHVPSLPR